MREALQRAWLRRGPLACLLWPLSLVFRAMVALRRWAYRAGVLRGESVGVPVIVVGNVMAGGTGKTPVVQAIVAHLLAKGVKVGIVSRGYGRRTDDCREVTPASSAQDVGDEPLLLARSCQVPVFVAPRRVEAARALLSAHGKTQVIVSDDGLQHYAMARDVEICLFDERGAGNGWLLPAGPLREPWPRPVDFVLGPGGHAVTRSLASKAIRADGATRHLSAFGTVTALAGIATPEAFFDSLRAAGVKVDRTIPLPDHHDFSAPLDLHGEVLCTEKDAVKLWRTIPGAWAVPLHVEIDAAFWRAFDAMVGAKLSSRRGSQTA